MSNPMLRRHFFDPVYATSRPTIIGQLCRCCRCALHAINHLHVRLIRLNAARASARYRQKAHRVLITVKHRVSQWPIQNRTTPQGAEHKCNKSPQQFGKKPHRCFVASRCGECIRPQSALGRHIRPRRQADNAQCTQAQVRSNGLVHLPIKVPLIVGICSLRELRSSNSRV